jgi:hypothetical protein
VKLENRQLRFITPFTSMRPGRIVRLGGRRGSIQLQETAMVVEGELLCFTFIIGLEWLFRRALSQWTTVTVPYSRIESVRLTRIWPLRVLTALIFAIWITLIVLLWDVEETVAPIMVCGAGLLVTMLYVNLRYRRSVRILFRGKDRLRLLAFRVQRKPLRNQFLESLKNHRAAVEQFQKSTVTVCNPAT